MSVIFFKKPTFGNNIKTPIDLDTFIPKFEEKLKIYDEEDISKMEEKDEEEKDEEENYEEENDEEGEENKEQDEEENDEEINNYLSYEYIDSIPSIVDNMYDDNIVFCFSSRSNTKPFPGEGVGESIPDYAKSDYNELHKIKDWRKMLSNNWIEPFKYDEKTWNSVEHYYQGSKFKNNNPEFYNLFSIESGSDISKSAELARSAGSKTGKHKGELVRDKNIKVDEDFYNTERHDREMYIAQYHKFTNPNAQYLRDMLLKTRDSKLMHIIMKNPVKEFFVNLVVFRNLLLNNKI